jgi:hypothetical protein
MQSADVCVESADSSNVARGRANGRMQSADVCVESADSSNVNAEQERM